jgi:hypothetical protein
VPIKSGIKCGFKCALRAYSMFKPPAYSLLQGSEMHGTSINAAPWNASSHRSFDGGRWGRLGSPGASALGSLWQARSLQNETGRGQRGAGIPACPRTFRRGRLALPLIRADSRPFAASFFVLFVPFVVPLPTARPTIHSRGFASIRGINCFRAFRVFRGSPACGSPYHSFARIRVHSRFRFFVFEDEDEDERSTHPLNPPQFPSFP